MFSFFKKREISPEPPEIYVDIHSHFIPGIDDGARTTEESLLLLKRMSDLGYKKVITTPHIMSDAYPNTPDIIRKGAESLRISIEENGIDIKLEAAAEYYLDEAFYDLIRKDEVLTIADRYLLFETSYVSKPLHTEALIFEISSAGYTPLMAHPERYRYIKDPKKEYGRLRDLGVMFQVNINSFGGHYGKHAKSLASFLSDAGMIDFLGSDTHHIKHTESLREVRETNEYRRIFLRNKIRNNELS